MLNHDMSYAFIESVRGCYPTNQTLPGLSGALIPPRSRCSFLPRRQFPVKVSKRDHSKTKSVHIMGQQIL